MAILAYCNIRGEKLLGGGLHTFNNVKTVYLAQNIECLEIKMITKSFKCKFIKNFISSQNNWSKRDGIQWEQDNNTQVKWYAGNMGE